MKCCFLLLLLLLLLSLELHHLGDPSDCPRGLSNSFNLQSVWVSVSHKNGKELDTPPPKKKKKKKKKKLRYLGANLYECVGVIFVFVLKNQQGGPRGRVGKVAKFQRSSHRCHWCRFELNIDSQI